jgi:hypothetical protein
MVHSVFKNYQRSILASLVLLTNFGYAASDILEGHIGGLSNQSSGQVGDVPGNRYNADFEFNYHRNVNTVSAGELEKKFHLATMMNDQNLTMYSVQEVFIGGNLTAKDNIKFGRKILPWAPVDSVWGFGKLNNRRNFNYFTPGEEGLTGLLYERKSSNGMRYRTFVSGIYVPEANPSLDVDKKDKSITSRHPWADVPARIAKVPKQDNSGQVVEMDINYDVNYPEISEVIYRYTVGANIGYESKHWVMDNFIMRKPENNLTPDVEVNVDFATRVVNANIDPRFYYHDVYGSSLKYRNLDIEMYVSGMAVRPNEFPDVDSDVRYTEIKTKKRREDYMGGGISKSNDLYTLALNYVARLSPFDRKSDEMYQDPRWNQAVNFFALRNFGRTYSLSGDVKFDMLTNDRLVMVRGIYNVTRNFMMNLGVNMIGTPVNGQSYWSPYTNNDAVYGGLRYVF